MSLTGTRIIAAGPHGFGGAVQAFCRCLESLGELQAEIVYVALEKPYPLRNKTETSIEFLQAELLDSEVIGYDTAPVRDKYVLLPSILAETMVKAAKRQPSARLVLWGTYLFPFAQSALMAKRILQAEGIEARLWISPVGSDIWEFSTSLAGVSASLLNDDLVEQIIAPSSHFIEAIKDRFSLRRPIQAIYPMIEMSRFRPPNASERLAARQALDIPEEAFVISNHSNMRPMKRLEDVLEISGRVAKQLSQPVVLLLVGPLVADLMESAPKNLDVRWIGVVDDVEHYLFASDLELNCSWHDSFNLSLAEAMACAVPCVSTDVVGVGSEILAAEAGVLFPYIAYNGQSDRYETAVETIIRIAQNPALATEMGKRGAAHAARVFASERLRGDYLTLLEGVAARQSR